ncbi:HRDC domain-containing protein [Pontibacter sp. 172403-2]|uniref:ribonuclease D n=1 Tax=Pontibacter rufus TaxID=2791028 RepID=UPI0018AFA1DF|nr:HRDC domain-containing protein [Pontibacter sp. 172403-2]MBF9255316.1 HRDC domain-containing protein [Pontibacter sp. 172403-2]
MENTPLSHDGVIIKLVASDEALQNAVEALQQHNVLALDLEFDQNRFTYGFNLCLIQITDGCGTCYVIDPFTIHDLQPFFHLLENPSITKIIHHSNNDIMLLSKLGCQIKGVLDTDVAAKLLNYERSSLATVLKEDFDIEIDKSQQSSNWNKRPLTAEQLRYAAIDVIYLHRIKDHLLAGLQEKGRLSWLEEENHLLEQITYAEAENPHMKLKEAFRLNLYQQFILKKLYEFRDKMARSFNKPAAYVIGNEALVELAKNTDIDLHEWLHHTKGIHGGLKKTGSEKQLKDAIAEAKREAAVQDISHDYPENRWQRPLRTSETEQRKEALTHVQKRIMEKYGEFTSRLIINQNLIMEYSQTGRLRCSKKYAADIVSETAEELGITLSGQV